MARSAVHHWRVGSAGSPAVGAHGHGHVMGHHSSTEDDRDVVGPARRALE